MIEATVILGKDAAREYEETGTIPSDNWLMENGGVVNRKEFRTKSEYDAYIQALSECSGWEDYHVIKHKEATENCPFCQNWSAFFADQITPVYCPDCGKEILNQPKV